MITAAVWLSSATESQSCPVMPNCSREAPVSKQVQTLSHCQADAVISPKASGNCSSSESGSLTGDLGMGFIICGAEVPICVRSQQLFVHVLTPPPFADPVLLSAGAPSNKLGLQYKKVLYKLVHSGAIYYSPGARCPAGPWDSQTPAAL